MYITAPGYFFFPTILSLEIKPSKTQFSAVYGDKIYIGSKSDSCGRFVASKSEDPEISLKSDPETYLIFKWFLHKRTIIF